MSSRQTLSTLLPALEGCEGNCSVEAPAESTVKHPLCLLVPHEITACTEQSVACRPSHETTKGHLGDVGKPGENSLYVLESKALKDWCQGQLEGLAEREGSVEEAGLHQKSDHLLR